MPQRYFSQTAIDFGGLPASLLMGWLWQHYGIEEALTTGVALASAAAALLLMFM